MREVLIVKISEFIESNGYITNAMARENFGFGSTKVKNLFNKLIIDTNKYKHFSNNTKLKTAVSKILNQQWLHQDIIEKIEEESNKELENENK